MTGNVPIIYGGNTTLPTIIDVAKKANVSKSTVSRVLAMDGNVSESAREAVEKAVAELHYVKNDVASSLRTRQSRIVLLIIPDVSNNFWAEVAKGAQTVLRDAQYSLMLANSDWRKESEEAYIQLALEKKVDAVIANVPELDVSKAFSCLGCPVVIIGERSRTVPYPVIGTDSYKTIWNALEYVYEKNHRKIAMVISSSLDSEGVLCSAKHAAYRDFLASKGLEAKDEWEIKLPLSSEGGVMLTEKFSSMKEKPTAILAGNDLVAVGFIKSATLKGIRVPEDVSVVGFDDIPMVGLMTPALTTMAKPKQMIGAAAAKEVLSLINGEKVPSVTLLDTALVERESVLRIEKI